MKNTKQITLTLTIDLSNRLDDFCNDYDLDRKSVVNWRIEKLVNGDVSISEIEKIRQYSDLCKKMSDGIHTNTIKKHRFNEKKRGI